MAWKKKAYMFENSIEVEEFHNGRYGAPGESRTKKRKATPEEIRKQNIANKAKRCRRKMKCNFKENDYWITLTYSLKERPPDMDTARKKDFKKFADKVRKEYKKAGQAFKWMLHTEIGSKGAVHHHMVINRIPDADIIIRKAWNKGGVHIALMYEEGGYRKLADYLSKVPDEENKLKESRYSCSRNLIIPKPKEKVYHRKTWKGEPKPPKGYYLEKESYHEGRNPVTGYQYRSYTFVRLHRRI